MDREQFREQVTQRYVTGKALDGASVDEIAEGMVDPVEQMTYVTGLPKTESTRELASGTGGNGGVMILVILLALAALTAILLRG